ncbi:methyltransferase [Streptomyces galilaeus]|nr:methyltransferase [Streptomyces galilaeus]
MVPVTVPRMTEASDFLTATRTFYDAIAEDYADHFHDLHAKLPWDRAVFALYAELVGVGGKVADLGCGPGRVTGHLASLGLSMSGLDLSESMLAVARRENPGLRFERGSMLELGHEDGSLDGVVSWYSSIHTPADRLPHLFAEFRRVLKPGGHALLAFQVGEEPRHLEQPWGHPVSLDFHRRTPEGMAGLLAEAGFSVRSRTVRAPEPELDEKVPQAYLVARA